MEEPGKNRKSGLIRSAMIIFFIFRSATGFTQDDFGDVLQALGNPLNITYFKENGFKELQVDYYKIKFGDTIFDGKTKYYKLENDSILSEYTLASSAGGNMKKYFKEDNFGNLNQVASLYGQEYPSKYVLNENGKPVIRKSIYGKQYFFYDSDGRITRCASDTFNIATNSPCSVIQYEYKHKQLASKISSVFDADTRQVISSDTLYYLYENKDVIAGYYTTENSTLGARSVRIQRSDTDQKPEIVLKEKNQVIRYSFKKENK